MESVVPVTVKLMGRQPKPPHLIVRNLLARLIVAGVEKCLHTQTTLGSRAPDQIDDRLITEERLAAPVHADERKQAVFDLVPLARAHSTYTIDNFRI